MISVCNFLWYFIAAGGIVQPMGTCTFYLFHKASRLWTRSDWKCGWYSHTFPFSSYKSCFYPVPIYFKFHSYARPHL